MQTYMSLRQLQCAFDHYAAKYGNAAAVKVLERLTGASTLAKVPEDRMVAAYLELSGKRFLINGTVSPHDIARARVHAKLRDVGREVFARMRAAKMRAL